MKEKSPDMAFSGARGRSQEASIDPLEILTRVMVG